MEDKKVENLTFEQYCLEVKGIPYYNLLGPDEYDFLFDQYLSYVDIE